MFGAPAFRLGQEASENEEKKTINLVRCLGRGAGWREAVVPGCVDSGTSDRWLRAGTHRHLSRKGYGGRKLVVALVVVVVRVLVLLVVCVFKNLFSGKATPPPC